MLIYCQLQLVSCLSSELAYKPNWNTHYQNPTNHKLTTHLLLFPSTHLASTSDPPILTYHE